MDLTLSPNEQAFRDELRDWLAENHPGESPTGDEAAFEFRKEWQRKLHDAGYAGLSWPEEYGGRGATLIEQAIFGEEMARAKAPAPANVLGLVMGGPVVIAHGTEEQKQRYLEPILSAEEIWCQGFSEPESGSDLASLKTKAVKSNGEWVVTGQKVWTTFAHEAKWCMLVARTDPDAPKHKGLTYFLMDMEQDEVQVRPLHQITGEAEFNELFIEEARIPDENVIGGVGNGWTRGHHHAHARARRPGRRAPRPACKIALGQLIELAQERGVDEDPVIRQKIAQLLIEVEALRLNAWRGLTAIMKTGIPGPEGSLPKLQWSAVNQGAHRAGHGDPRRGGGGQGLRLDLPLPARPRQLDRGRHHRDPQEHHRRARARPAEAAMNFDFTDDQQAIKRTAHDLLAQRFKPDTVRELAEARALRRRPLDRAGRARLAGHLRRRGARRPGPGHRGAGDPDGGARLLARAGAVPVERRRRPGAPARGHRRAALAVAAGHRLRRGARHGRASLATARRRWCPTPTRPR